VLPKRGAYHPLLTLQANRLNKEIGRWVHQAKELGQTCCCAAALAIVSMLASGFAVAQHSTLAVCLHHGSHAGQQRQQYAIR